MPKRSSEETRALKALEDALGYRFSRIQRLQDALTHRSYVNEHRDSALRDNERLEFLGDAVIGLAAAASLFRIQPSIDEGEMTRRRAEMVSEVGLSELAKTLKLGPLLRLGKGEATTGGRKKTRLLSSALEACIGAVCEDGGMSQALSVAERLLGTAVHHSGATHRDHKSRFQEAVQARFGVTPTYRLARSEGPDHARHFFVEVLVNEESWGEGDGPSKASAEQAAAERALLRLDDK